MSSDLLFMLFLIPMQGGKKNQPGLLLENTVVGSEKGVGGQEGKIVTLAWRYREFPDDGNIA